MGHDPPKDPSHPHWAREALLKLIIVVICLFLFAKACQLIRDQAPPVNRPDNSKPNQISWIQE